VQTLEVRKVNRRSGRSIDNDLPIPPLISNKGRLGGTRAIPPLISNKGRLGGVRIVSPFVLRGGQEGLRICKKKITLSNSPL